MASPEEVANSFGWPTGLAEIAMKSKNSIAFRFLLVDNSLSMSTKKGHRLVDLESAPSYEICTRWEAVSASVKNIAKLADLVEAPTEIRLLNNSSPIIVGQSNSQENLATILSQLDAGPAGQSSIDKDLTDIIQQIKGMEQSLITDNKIALLIIISDSKSSDNSIVDTMSALEGLPVKVVIQISSCDKDQIEYWSNLNSQLKTDLHILLDFEGEAKFIQPQNSWLNYGLPLHQAREFGIMVPEVDKLGYHKLSEQEIKIMGQILWVKCILFIY